MKPRLHAISLILASLLIIASIALITQGGAEQELETVTIYIRLEAPSDAYRLRFSIIVANLTTEGIKTITTIRTRVVEGYLTAISIKMWEKFLGYCEKLENGKLVKIPEYFKYGIFIYAVAYDEGTKTFYYGSWTAGIDPYYNKTVNVQIKVKVYHSREIPVTDVPDIGQSKTFYKNLALCAVKIPGYTVWNEVNIPYNMRVDVDSYEKLYWTESSYPREPDTVWYEEDWENSGTTSVHTCEWHGSCYGPSSTYFYLTNVKYIEATTGSIIPGGYSYVIVKVYAVDDHYGVFTNPWNPSGSLVEWSSISRPYSAYVKEELGYVLRAIYISYTTEFASVAGSEYSAEVRFQETVSYQITAGYIKIGIDSWDSVPSEYNVLKVYRVSGKKGFLLAQFEP